MSIFSRTQEPVSSENAILYVNSRRCPQNHPCPSIRVCPTNALIQRGYGLPLVDMEKCIRCGKCVHYCPMGALELRHA